MDVRKSSCLLTLYMLMLFAPLPLPTVFNPRANLPLDLLFLFVIGHSLAYSGRYLTIPLVANHLCVDFTIPHTAGPRRLISHSLSLTPLF